MLVHSFWVHTMTTEWDLVCDRVAWKTVAKLVLFTGKGIVAQDLSWQNTRRRQTAPRIEKAAGSLKSN